MGLTPADGTLGILELGLEELFTRNSSPPPTINTELLSVSPTDNIVLDFPNSIEGNIASTASTSSTQPHPSEISRLPRTQVSMPSPIQSPNASTSRAAPRRRRRLLETPSSTTALTPRRRRMLQARTQRVQTPLERATGEYVIIQNRRLQLEEERERNHHQREMEHLRLESRRIDMEENRNRTLVNLTGALGTLTDILPHLRREDTTDILPYDS